MSLADLVATEPEPGNGYPIQIPAETGVWRWVVELADPGDDPYAEWLDITDYYAGDRHQFGADTYLGAARARLIAVQLQINDSDMLAPWGQDTTSIFGTDVRLDAGMLMRAGFIRVAAGVVEEWHPIWTGRVERWGDESAARGQVRRHIVNVVDTMSDLANVPVQFDDSAANWPEYFEDFVLTPANWLFGVDMYGDESPAIGFTGDEALTPAINRMDNGVAPLGFVWRTLRSGRLVIHPAPWNTTSVERYDNPLLDVYPDGVRFNYSPDFTDVDYIADDDQQPFGIERTVDGILNYFVVTWPDGFDTDTYAIDDPVSIGRYGVRPFSASWIREGEDAVDDLMAARAYASAQALPLRTQIDHDGFWPAMAMLDHMDPVTVIHATSPEGLVVTGTGTIRNIVEERTFRGEAGGDYALSWQSTVQIDLDATETSAALLPVEDLVLVEALSPLLSTTSTAEFSWTNPTQPDITPTEVQLRIPERSLIWMSEEYPGVGADGSLIGALNPGTSYTLEVRLIRRVDGTIVAASVIRSVAFTTPALIYPTPVEGDDPTDTNVDMDDVPFEDCDDDVSIELQEQDEIGGAWVTVDTFSGSEIVLVDGVWHLVDDIPNSFFNDGSMYRFVGYCGDELILTGGGFDPPDDWSDPCTTPPALAVPPFDDANLKVYVPQICAPDTIKEAVSGLVAVHGPALASIGSLLGGDPDERALLAVADPAWSDAPSGILAYGECPQVVGAVGDKTWVAKVFVTDAAFTVFGECAAGRITCTPSGSGWKAGGTVFTADGTASLLSAELPLSSSDPTYIAVTYDASTGDTKLWLSGVEENDTTFGEARNTVAALPIWRVGAPPESWMTDFAMFDRILAPEEMPGFEPPPTVTINKAVGQADPAFGGSIQFTAVFSEAVSGFATGDVTVSGTAGGTTGTVTGTGPTYTVTVTGMTQSGTVIATIAAAVCTSVATGLPNLASTSTDNTVDLISDDTPLDLTGLLAWWDGADPEGDGVPPSDGTGVNPWVDKSTNTHDLTRDGGAQFRSNDPLNGFGCIEFDGVDDGYHINSAFMFANGTIETWIVFKSDESGIGALLAEGISSNGSANYVVHDIETSDDVQFGFANTSNVTRFANAQDRGTGWQLAICTDYGAATGTNVEVVDVDAGTSGAYTRDSTAFNRLSVGFNLRSTSTQWYDGRIAEILVFSAHLGSGDRAALTAYLNAKWGQSWTPV